MIKLIIKILCPRCRGDKVTKYYKNVTKTCLECKGKGTVINQMEVLQCTIVKGK